MFDIDAGKILVVGVVALLVIGPKDLPRVLRTVGQTVGKMRRMAAEFQNQFMEAIKEADLEDVKKEISAINESAKIDASFDPASMMRNEITTAVEGPHEIGQSVIDLTGPAVATAKTETKEIGAPAHDAAALESLPAAPSPDKVAGQASEGAIAQGAGEAVRQGDRG
jgi:sec-independent protein translocase protein TatB